MSFWAFHKPSVRPVASETIFDDSQKKDQIRHCIGY